MRANMKPYVTAGVALVGVGVIAATPITPPPAPTLVVHETVQLAAVPSPLQLYPQVILRSLTNAGTLFQEYFADPFPIVNAILQNQEAAFTDAVTALQFGRFDEFFAAAADIVLRPFADAGTALSHLGALLLQPNALEGFFLIAISPVLSGLAATGNAIGEVFDAAMSLDLVGVVNAVLNIPARIIDGVLNGVPGASFGILDNLPGLLTPSDPESDLPPGPISVGINIDQDMGAAIPPRESSLGVDEMSDPAAATFMLRADVDPPADPQPGPTAADATELPGGTQIDEDGEPSDDALTDTDSAPPESDDLETEPDPLDSTENVTPAAGSGDEGNIGVGEDPTAAENADRDPGAETDAA